VRGCDTDNQGRRGNDSVVGAEHRRTKPADAMREVLLDMTRARH
jgi:hypothetical protein